MLSVVNAVVYNDVNRVMTVFPEKTGSEIKQGRGQRKWMVTALLVQNLFYFYSNTES